MTQEKLSVTLGQINNDLKSAIAAKLDKESFHNLEKYIQQLEKINKSTDLANEDEIEYWLKQAEEIQSDLEDALKGNDQALQKITDAFYTDLEFGTGGMRGIIGPGSNRINFFTIGRASQGFGKWLSAENPDKKLSVVIAHDSRRLSQDLAEKSALILAAQGIKAWLFSEVAPTPLLSFAVRHLEADGGIVITASHNPPEYNGFKVYRSDGCQIPPPRDKDIIDYVEKESDYESIAKDQALAKGLLEYLNRDFDKNYIKSLEKIRMYKENQGIRVAYSPLHGTGGRLVPEVFSKFNAGELLPVKAQIEPDGEFPTVAYPNPEDPEALKMLVELGIEKNADVILANDPDADRVGIGVRNGGGFTLLNGNQTGSILAYYVLSRLQEEKRIPKDAVLVKTIVTTELQKAIADSFNVRTINTLTGFKYIGDWMARFDAEGGGTYVFGGEESYGYLMEDFVRDKDGISASYFVAEAANYYKSQGKSLLDVLDEIYRKYGLYVEKLFTEKFPGKSGMEQMAAIMENTRNTLPTKIGGVDVLSIYDIKIGQRINVISNEKTEDKTLPSSNVIQFELEGGGTMTLRPSGTEPKIKFYFSIPEKLAASDDSEEKSQSIEKNIDVMMADFREKIITPLLA